MSTSSSLIDFLPSISILSAPINIPLTSYNTWFLFLFSTLSCSFLDLFFQRFPKVSISSGVRLERSLHFALGMGEGMISSPLLKSLVLSWGLTSTIDGVVITVLIFKLSKITPTPNCVLDCKMFSPIVCGSNAVSTKLEVTIFFSKNWGGRSLPPLQSF